ncbi:MAG: patatin family protein [Treponema sp.]|nr:patatin family protein [Treponema sp.]
MENSEVIQQEENLAENKQIKIGLVMEGGAMRGMFTAGVIDVLMESGITVDGAIGVSAGATFGCNYKSNQVGRVIRYNKALAKDKRYCSFRSLMKTGDLYGANFCYNVLPNELDIFDYQAYRANPMKFFVVASDCKTGEPIYRELETCDETDLTWMRASASMPIVSKVVKIDDYCLLDGGMTDSIPLKAFEKMGYEKNIVILTQPRDYLKKKNKLFFMMKMVLRKYPKLLVTMGKRHENYNNAKKYVFEQAEAGNAFVICPKGPLCAKRIEHNPQKLQQCYNEGRLLAKNQLDEIKAFIKGEE